MALLMEVFMLLTASFAPRSRDVTKPSGLQPTETIICLSGSVKTLPGPSSNMFNLFRSSAAISRKPSGIVRTSALLHVTVVLIFHPLFIGMRRC